MDKTKTTLVTILVILLFGIPVVIGKSQNRVLVIHSTSANSSTAIEINRGMELYSNNHPNFSNNVIIEHYYLDMDNPNRQKCEIYLTEIQNTKNLITDQKPDLVILSGDMTQRLIGILLISLQSSNTTYLTNNANWLAESGGCTKNSEQKEKLLAEANPVHLNYALKTIFTGVTHDDVKDYGYYESPNMAGIYKRLYIPAIKDTVQDIYESTPDDPDSKPVTVIVVGDASSVDSKSIQQLKTELSKENSLNAPLEWGEIKKAESWEQWKNIILDANQNNSIIFITGYKDLISANLSGEDIVQWTETCSKSPVFGGTESFVTDGGMLGIASSNQEQGSKALEFAQQLLSPNRQTENITFIESEQFTVEMNKNLLNKRQINLPVIYEAFSRESDNYLDQTNNYSTNCQ